MQVNSDSDGESGKEGEVIPHNCAKTVHEISSLEEDNNEQEDEKSDGKDSDGETDFLAEYKEGQKLTQELASVSSGS